MTIVSRASALLATAALCLSLTPAAGFNAQPDRLTQLVERLETWLDAASDYPRQARPAAIRRVAAADAVHMVGYHASAGLRTRALYDPQTATIHLIEPWSLDEPLDVAVLLHELVHHRQQGRRHFYCAGAREPEAYRLQADWLAERGIEAPINWIAVTIDAGCARRDIHAD